ncbi:glutaredoxin family protein [Pseudalkalibacillus sp. A8]|uniref:glutaredoxin family protein n=1 Tax=Pseudalkalibacillus sp. A8 TaxID=3382641 RepID=UPI0038B4EF58
MMTAILYTINGCSKCQNIKNFLQEFDLKFNEINICEQPEFSKEVQKHVGEFYVPIFIYRNTIIKGDRISEIKELVGVK